MSLETIRSKLMTAFPASEIEVRDTTGGGDHFDARVVSARFEGLGLIDRHRLVYDALGESMRTDIHALALTTLTPEEKKRP